MIRILKDGSKYCEKWSKICDSVCEQCDEYKNSMFTQNSTIIEELEKIKAELTQYRININAGSDEFHIGRLFGCDDIISIIDKHISELKGE